MKNEKKFKERISSLAAMIAEGNYEGKEVEEKPEEEMEEPKKDMEEAEQKSDGEKVAAILSKISSLSTPLNLVDQASEFTDLLKGLIEMMPKLTPQRAIAGMNTLRNELATSSAANSTPATSKKDKGAMFDKMKVPKGVASDSDLPALQEAFNRINRK
jgi:hypothetical protein